MNNETGARQPAARPCIPDVPIDRSKADAASGGTGIFMRLRREWTNLHALVTIEADLVVANACDGLFGGARGLQPLASPVRQVLPVPGKFPPRMRIRVEHLREAFGWPEKARLGKTARAHPGFNLFQWNDDVSFLSLYQSIATLPLPSCRRPGSLVRLRLQPGCDAPDCIRQRCRNIDRAPANRAVRGRQHPEYRIGRLKILLLCVPSVLEISEPHLLHFDGALLRSEVFRHLIDRALRGPIRLATPEYH